MGRGAGLTVACVVVLSLFLGLGGCGHSDDHEKAPQLAVAIESGDECHLCGMVIGEFPGPKGELYLHGQPRVHKFCSTRDLFAFLLQPENRHRASQIYVHDMVQSPWNSPDDNHFIDAQSAWYVAGHSQPGAMGATLASFALEADAIDFAHLYGGEVLTFQSISLELLAEL